MKWLLPLLVGCAGADSDDHSVPLPGLQDTGPDVDPFTPILTVVHDGQVLADGGALDLGAVATGGEIVTAELIVTNPGDSDLTLAAEITGAGFAWQAAPPATIGPDASVTLVVQFSAEAEGSATGAIELADGAWSATLGATGVGPPNMILVGAGGRILRSTDGGLTWPDDSFVELDGGHTESMLRGACAGEGVVIAVGGATQGTYTRSLDGGSTWDSPWTDERSWVADCAYGDGMFVTVGGFGNLATSLDGELWVPTYRDYDTHLRAVAFGNGLFVAVGGDRRAVTDDGVTWDSDLRFTGTDVGHVAFGNGVFVGVGGAGLIVTSADGVTWQSQTVGSANRYGVAFGNGVFVTGGWPGGQLTSTDGVNWTETEGNEWMAPYGAAAGVFVGSAWQDRVLISSDGVDWTEVKGNTVPDLGFSDFVSL